MLRVEHVGIAIRKQEMIGSNTKLSVTCITRFGGSFSTVKYEIVRCYYVARPPLVGVRLATTLRPEALHISRLSEI